MQKVSSCVLCDGEIVLKKKAMVAPFLAQRIWQRKAFQVDLVQCLRCDFTFFNPRLEPREAEILYSGYRSPEYQQMRQQTEPWYTPKFNEGLQSDAEMAGRRRVVADLLRPYISQKSPKILDFGGNRGELVDGLIPGSEPYVYDISGVTPLANVQRCPSLDEARSKSFDLIVNSNVLEHVSFPREIIDQMTSVAVPGTQAFIEVPYESPFDRMTIFKRIAQEGVLALSRPAVALSLARPSGLYLMHEHINFFTPKSLAALLTAAGWKILGVDFYSSKGLLGESKVAWCVAQRA